MVYWKIDDETIRCLINEDEIGKMGFDLEQLKSGDKNVLEDLISAIMKDSHNYIQWNTENGIQNYAAKALPASQYLITISCTFQEEAINKDLAQIRRMIEALNLKIPIERITEIEKMTGLEKEKAFDILSRDLHDVCTGKSAMEMEIASRKNEQESQNNTLENSLHDQKEETSLPQDSPKRETFPAQKLHFHSMNEILEFASLLDPSMIYPSQLYRMNDEYDLLVDFDDLDDKVDIITMIITAEEYGAQSQSQGLSRYYLAEHGDLLIAENALGILRSFSR